LAYCGRKTRYLAHQITAPQIAGAKAILERSDLPPKRWININSVDITDRAVENLSRTTRVDGRKKVARRKSNFTSPAPNLTLRRIGAAIRLAKRLFG
jgi:hypothetical protein